MKVLENKEKSAVFKRYPRTGGEGWIRTTELIRGQIYSLLPLTTRPPLHKMCVYYARFSTKCQEKIFLSHPLRHSEEVFATEESHKILRFTQDDFLFFTPKPIFERWLAWPFSPFQRPLFQFGAHVPD